MRLLPERSIPNLEVGRQTSAGKECMPPYFQWWEPLDGVAGQLEAVRYVAEHIRPSLSRKFHFICISYACILPPAGDLQFLEWNMLWTFSACPHTWQAHRVLSMLCWASQRQWHFWMPLLSRITALNKTLHVPATLSNSVSVAGCCLCHCSACSPSWRRARLRGGANFTELPNRALSR